MGLRAQDIHVSHTLVVKSSPARLESASRNSYRFSRNSILTVIILAMLAILGFTIFNFIATPEFLVKHKIEGIVDDYYQNYFYDSIPEPESLSYYTKNGLSRLSLRQLLLYSDRKHQDSQDFFSKYCNLGATSVTIYPEEPFGRNNYHAEYSYSCKF